MEALAVYKELKLHGRVAQEHFKQELERSLAACKTYGNDEDIVECLQKGGQMVKLQAERYLAKNAALALKLDSCLKIDQEKDAAAWKSCVAEVKNQIPKLSFKD